MQAVTRNVPVRSDNGMVPHTGSSLPPPGSVYEPPQNTSTLRITVPQGQQVGVGEWPHLGRIVQEPDKSPLGVRCGAFWDSLGKLALGVGVGATVPAVALGVGLGVPFGPVAGALAGVGGAVVGGAIGGMVAWCFRTKVVPSDSAV